MNTGLVDATDGTDVPDSQTANWPDSKMVPLRDNPGDDESLAWAKKPKRTRRKVATKPAKAPVEMSLEEALTVVARAAAAGNVAPLEYLIEICRGEPFDPVKAAAACRS